MSSVLQRVFNGKTSSPHLGLDFRVPTGTPVAAMNDGTVLLARPLYFEGNFVVIDHGQGLLTLYLHLSEFKVKEGDQVKRGQVIALSGGTGRATGPHLHVSGAMARNLSGSREPDEDATAVSSQALELADSTWELALGSQQLALRTSPTKFVIPSKREESAVWPAPLESRWAIYANC